MHRIESIYIELDQNIKIQFYMQHVDLILDDSVAM